MIKITHSADSFGAYEHYTVWVNDVPYFYFTWETNTKNVTIDTVQLRLTGDQLWNFNCAADQLYWTITSLREDGCAHINTHNVISDYGEEFTVCNDCGEGWH